MQILLIKYLLTPLALIKEKLPERVWKILASVSVFGICLTQFAYGTGLISRYLIACVPFCLCFGIFILSGLSSDTKPVRFSWPMLICWFGVALMTLLTGILVEPNRLGIALIWLVAFPVYFIAWRNRTAEELAKPIINGAYLSFAVLLLISIFRFPIQGAQYMSFYSNQNSLALYSTAVYILALVDALSQKKFGARMLLAYAVLGMAAALIMYTNARGGQLSAAIGTAAAFICVLCSKKKRRMMALACSFLPVVLSVVVFVSSGVYIFKFGYELPARIEAMLSASEVTEPVATEPVMIGPSVTEPTVMPTEEPTVPPTINAGTVIDSIINTQEIRQDKVNGGLNEFTSGRVEIWKIYLAEVGFLGNPNDKVLYYGDGEPLNLSSHMALLQMAYDTGILSALFFFLLNIISGLKAVAYAFKGKAEAYTLLPVVVAVTYGAYYLVEASVSPVTILLAFIYLMSQTLLIKVEKREEG